MNRTMSTDFKLPDLGEGVHEGQVIKLHVSAGESIREDEPLMEVETDKAAVEIPSPCTGRVERVHVEEKQLVHVGDVMFTFDTGEEAGQSSATEPTVTIAAAPSTPVAAPAPPRSTGRKAASPSVRRLARTMNLSLEDIHGSGPGGRITRADVEAHSAGETVSTDTAASPQVELPATSITPVAAAPQSPLAVEGIEDTDEYGAIVRQSLSQARKTISRVMSTAWQTIPHVTDCNDADITELDCMNA